MGTHNDSPIPDEKKISRDFTLRLAFASPTEEIRPVTRFPRDRRRNLIDPDSSTHVDAPYDLSILDRVFSPQCKYSEVITDEDYLLPIERTNDHEDTTKKLLTWR